MSATSLPQRNVSTASPAKRAVRGAPIKWTMLVASGFALVCVVLVVGVFASSAPVRASVLKSFASPTATRFANFAHVELARPSQTPSPTFTATHTATPIFTATLIPTETLALLEMSLLADTPTPERPYVNPADAPAVSSAGGEKYILVDISEQHMYVYEGGGLIYSFVASTGINNGTRTGVFHVLDKIPNAYGANWNIWMPNWLGIYWAGSLENGIHALPILPGGSRLWAGYLGTPISYGCVVLGVYESQILYDWADVGTTVEIQW